MKVSVVYSNRTQTKSLSINSHFEKIILNKMTKRAEFSVIKNAKQDEAKYKLTSDFYRFWQSVCEAFNQVFIFTQELSELFEKEIIETIILDYIEHSDISEAPQNAYNHLNDYFFGNMKVSAIKLKNAFNAEGIECPIYEATHATVGISYKDIYLPANYKEIKVAKGKIEILVDATLNTQTKQWELADFNHADYKFSHNREESFEKAGWKKTEHEYLSNLLNNTKTVTGKKIKELVNDYLKEQITLLSPSTDKYTRLEFIGTNTWGYPWQKEMAKALGYKGAGNIRAWRTNGNVPDIVFPRLKEALIEHANKTMALAETLP